MLSIILGTTLLIVLAVLVVLLIDYRKIYSKFYDLEANYDKDCNELRDSKDAAILKSTLLQNSLSAAESKVKDFNLHLENILHSYQRVLSSIYLSKPEVFKDIFETKFINEDSVVLQLRKPYISKFDIRTYDQPVDLQIKELYKSLDLVKISYHKDVLNDTLRFVVKQRDTPGFIIAISPDILLTLKHEQDLAAIITERIVQALDEHKFNFRY